MQIRTRINNFLHWRYTRNYFIKSIFALISGFIAGMILAIAMPQTCYDLVDFYFVVRDVNSVPLVQILGAGDFLHKISFLIKTNVLYECIVGLFLPGIFNLALVALLIKYTFFGMLTAVVASSDFSIAIPLMLLVAIFEAIGFSMASTAGDNIGRVWLKSKKGSSRIHALKESFKKSMRLLLSAIVILIISSFIELGLSYLLLM